MLFNSLEFLIFFPIVLVVYYVVPNRIKYLWLLVASYYFYMCWNAKYAVLILGSTIITYVTGLLLERVKGKETYKRHRQVFLKLVVAVCFTANLGILFYFKYFEFASELLRRVFAMISIDISAPTYDILLPVGISFYTFQALGYTIDVYRGEIYAERNFFKYALFVSFFPQLVAGPIERSKNLLTQLAQPKKWDFDNLREGSLLMIWGYFLKIVLADRIGRFVDNIYRDYDTYTGYYLLIATVLFAFQIYCDFSGYSNIAIGAAKILGIDLMDNFESPYLAGTVSEFWRRWHISLTSWFKDYLYIPLGGSRKGKVRTYINKLIVFLASGLWHGASISFVIWGGINGLYQVLGEVLLPVRNRMVRILKLNVTSFGTKLIRVLCTFVLVDFSWIFFRANSTKEAVTIIHNMVTVQNPWILVDGSLYTCGLDSKNFWLMIISIIVLLFADCLKVKGIKIRNVIMAQDYWFRWIVYAGSILVVLLFGIWGPAFNNKNFIYFQF